mmetsp:Transcript_22846/g.53428  ORF Transcript_22846/g.53428 Transcript_22846/m.53428 type:complete len:229 (+) Transcript_22846:258-944(+)
MRTFSALLRPALQCKGILRRIKGAEAGRWPKDCHIRRLRLDTHGSAAHPHLCQRTVLCKLPRPARAPNMLKESRVAEHRALSAAPAVAPPGNEEQGQQQKQALEGRAPSRSSHQAHGLAYQVWQIFRRRKPLLPLTCQTAAGPPGRTPPASVLLPSCPCHFFLAVAAVTPRGLHHMTTRKHLSGTPGRQKVRPQQQEQDPRCQEAVELCSFQRLRQVVLTSGRLSCSP